jgi:D-alanyl-D-alanine carboxypeptidase
MLASIFRLIPIVLLHVTCFICPKIGLAQNATNYNMQQKEKALQGILDKSVDNKKVFGTSFAVKRGDYTWQGVAGTMATEQQYYIASTTKLFTTAIILKLREEGRLSLEDKISQYVSSEILSGLHVFKGKDYSHDITIKHLLAHTSGLPDYFQDKGASGKSLEDEIVAGMDQRWSFEESIARSKRMAPLFAPGTKGKAKYSDVNFQLLGHIIEVITKASYAANCESYIFKPLNLIDTYLYTDSTDRKPKTLYYKQAELIVPKAMTSFGADGGIVSTTADMLSFTVAFFTGKLFPKAYLEDMQDWNSIFFPMKSGMGIHMFKLPWIFNPTGAVPYFIGHSGLSGALAFYSPKHDLYIVGTVNQVAHPDLSFKTMIKLAQIVLKQ